MAKKALAHPAPYNVYALRYATLATTRQDVYFDYSTYGESDGPLQMDYYFWLLTNQDHTILVDTGFNEAAGRRRGRTLLTPTDQALKTMGVSPSDVDLIIVSHMHYDHIGNLALFPNAAIAVARSELEFWTGPFANRPQFMKSTELNEIQYLQSLVETGRVSLLEADQEIAPGVEVRIVGGHTPGQLIVLVKAEEAPIVLASDSLHFYEEVERDRPFHVLFHLEDMYKTYELLRELESQHGALIVAGHDPEVMNRFPPLPGPLGRGVQIAAEPS